MKRAMLITFQKKRRANEKKETCISTSLQSSTIKTIIYYFYQALAPKGAA